MGMSGKIAKKNEKLLENVELENFDFLEIPELYIHSGQLNKHEIDYVLARLDEMKRVRENCDIDSVVRMKLANERAIMNHLGEMRYRRLQLRMQMYLKEYCERFIESNDDDFVKRDPMQIKNTFKNLVSVAKDMSSRLIKLFR